MMDLILLGPPGAGKGTQAKLMVDRWSVPQVSTGDILRAAVREGTALGREAKGFMDSGELVPDRVVIGIIAERVKQPDAGKGFILDGFPRTIPQAEALEKILGGMGRRIDAVVSLEVDEEALVKRLTGRRMCKGCGESFHVEFNPPKKEGVCSRCGGELYQRDDDKEATIRQRLAVYNAQTAPLITFYDKQKKLRRIKGDGGIQDIFARIEKALSPKKGCC